MDLRWRVFLIGETEWEKGGDRGDWSLGTGGEEVKGGEGRGRGGTDGWGGGEKGRGGRWAGPL